MCDEGVKTQQNVTLDETGYSGAVVRHHCLRGLKSASTCRSWNRLSIVGEVWTIELDGRERVVLTTYIVSPCRSNSASARNLVCCVRRNLECQVQNSQGGRNFLL